MENCYSNYTGNRQNAADPDTLDEGFQLLALGQGPLDPKNSLHFSIF